MTNERDATLLDDEETPDLVICVHDHVDEEQPIVEGTEEYDAETLALEADWIETDEGWLCPDPRHERESVMTYEVTPGVEGSESVFCTSGDGVLEAMAWLLSELPEEGTTELDIHVKRSPSTVGEVRKMFEDDEDSQAKS
jgi:hypothetical protein